MASRIPVHIISGFIGVGKTTAAANVADMFKGKESVALVVNESGRLQFDSLLMKSAYPNIPVHEMSDKDPLHSGESTLAQVIMNPLGNREPPYFKR
jgi:hypothetical protein